MSPIRGRKEACMATSKGKRFVRAFDPDQRVKVVKTALAKDLTLKEVREVFGVPGSTWSKWKQIYTARGEEALRKYGQGTGKSKKGLPPAAEEKIRRHVVAVKEKYPFFGVMRVWQWMLRSLFLPVSYRQVRSALAEAKLLGKKPRKKRQPPKPRRFERARPNELWQGDITEFSLAGDLTVYLIAFMDDHSRYLVSWGLYAACTSDLVLEVLRRGLSTYGRPKEILTDNGPQYKTWRGTTQFQKYLRKEDIRHILARPHHPETLGKIESFWAQMKREFLGQTKRKGDLEETRTRLAHWVNFYNFQRPHTEIKAAPAERFFQYQEAMRAEIAKRIKENEKELALSESPPTEVLGETVVGDQAFQVRKEGEEFIVLLGDREVNRTDLGKEERREEKEAAAGKAGGGGLGSQSEGLDGAPSPGRGEDDLGGVPGDGTQAVNVLQAGRPNGGGDAPSGPDAPGAGQATGRGGGSDESGGRDGAPQAGAPADAEPRPGHQEALPPEGAQRGPGEAPEGHFHGPGPRGDGDASPPGSAAGPSDDTGLKKVEG
jgi:transposase InsO family protein